MPTHEVLTALPASSLYQRCDPSTLPFTNTTELEGLDNYFGQDRAIEALRFGVGIEHEGYNIFVMGPAGMGKHQMALDFIHQYARQCPQPSDWCYVNNFSSPYQPMVMKLPAGKACELQRDMEQCIEDLLITLPKVFQSSEYKVRVSEINEEYDEKEQRAIGELREKAKQQNIALLETKTGYTLTPIINDKTITHKEFTELSEEEERRIENTINGLKVELKEILLNIPLWMKEGREQLKNLNRDIVQNTVNQTFGALEKRYSDLTEVIRYLQSVKQDVTENVDDFNVTGNASVPDNIQSHAKAFFPYKINVLVDNSQSCGAPVIYEDNPTLINLLGRVEHESQFGTLTTNFTLIKAGALHKANGGYLLLDAIKVLSNSFSWQALKRALQSREAKIESAYEMLSLASTKSLEPEAVPLDLKVVLMGDRMIYYLLQAYDPDFNLLFKVPADLSEDMARTTENSLSYARLIAAIQHKENIRPLDQYAVARVIEEGSRRLEDTKKLSLHLVALTDLLFESDFFASEDKADTIAIEHVQQAIDAAIRRLDQFRERMQESILREIQLVDTEGEKVAQINGLSVYQLGEYSFGRPTRITAQTRLGSGKVIDIEREVKLGGKIHSKGVMILSSFLANRYAKNKPLPISASLVFEQSYGGVEGDSASIAELSVLISSIAKLPIKQSLAVTGSVNQHGQVQAIGGINQKIEGYFDICSSRDLTGEQGIIMPQANVQHLMLEQKVIDAVENGMFHIYAIDSIDEALTLLMDFPAGEQKADGVYPEESINGRVITQIDQWVELSAKFSAHHDNDDDDEKN